MFGGTVIGIVRMRSDTILNVEDECGEWLAVRVLEQRIEDHSPIQVRLGDCVQLANKSFLWKAKEAKTWDTELPMTKGLH